MTIKLTHEQAGVVRNPCNYNADLTSQCLELNLIDLTYSDVTGFRPTAIGRKALAAYDAETQRLFAVVRAHSCSGGLSQYVLNELKIHLGIEEKKKVGEHALIEAAELQRLQDLECHLDNFFEDSPAGDAAHGAFEAYMRSKEKHE